MYLNCCGCVWTAEVQVDLLHHLFYDGCLHATRCGAELLKGWTETLGLWDEQKSGLQRLRSSALVHDYLSSLTLLVSRTQALDSQESWSFLERYTTLCWLFVFLNFSWTLAPPPENLSRHFVIELIAISSVKYGHICTVENINPTSIGTSWKE